MDIDQSAEILRLRSTVRDLLALSIIPEVWVAREPPAIAADLADLLIGSLKLDFAFVRLCDPTGCQVVEVTRGNSWKTFQEWLQQHLTVVGQISRKEIVTNVNGVEDPCCGIVIPVGVDSKRGLVVAVSHRSDFPDQIDQQLLSVAANNAATAFQNAFLINELRSAQEALRKNEQELCKARGELEIKVAERTAELRRSERELRNVIDTIPAIVWSALPDGSNTYVNKRFVEYSGSSAEQTSGSGWQALIHPDDLERHAGKWMEAVATGQPHENEVRSRRSDGQYRWHLDRGVPLRDEDGNIVKWYGVTTDIEDRKRAEQALQLTSHDLQDSKAKLEEAQRITHVGYWEWNLVTDCLIWSDETYRIFGLRPQERPMKVDALREMIHPEDRDRVFGEKEQSITSGVSYDVEHRIVRPSGEVRVLNSTRAVKRDESGRPTHFYGTVQDITDRKRAEEALQQSQFYLAEGQRLAHMGSWAFDAAGFTYWSSELFQIHGLDPSDKPPTIEEYLALVHPEDRAFMKQGVAKMLDDHLAFDFTKRIVRPDGEIRSVRCVGVPVTQGGTFQGFLGTGMDVTELKRAEEELQRLVDFVPQLIVVFDSDGKVIHANRVAREYTGLTLEEFRSLDVIGRVIHPDDVERVRAARKHGFAGSEPFELDARFLGKDGICRWFLGRYNPLVEEGRVRRWYVSATEIESRKQEEERVRKENVRLEERTRIAQELHDTLLQTFLSASMQLSVAVDGVPAESQVKPLLDRILRIMKQGIEEGRNTIQDLRSTDTHPFDLVAALSGIRQELAADPNVGFHVVVAGRQQPLEPLIQHEIYRIGREALVNAFCHSQAKRIEFELEYADHELRMGISDNGCGIGPQVLRSGREGHWGLAGMRERATRIGGLLKISSSETKGTEVQLSIPGDIAFQLSPTDPGLRLAKSG